MIFRVIDPKTGNEPIFDGNHLFREKWFKESHLLPFDIDGFALTENGNLILIDDCNNIAYVPKGRFDVVVESVDSGSCKTLNVRESAAAHYIAESDGYADGNLLFDTWYCSNCNYMFDEYDDEKPTYKYCPNCGAKFEK